MSWKKSALIALILFAVGFLMIGSRNEISIVVKLGAITIFFSVISPLIMKLWFAAEKTKTQKAILGLFIVFFLYLLTMALVPPKYIGEIPAKSGTGEIVPLRQ